MSDRERWIVYPLLFLALGVALRDKLTRSIEGVDFLRGNSVRMNLDEGFIQSRVIDADVIRCERLEVRESPDKPLVILGGVTGPSNGGGTPQKSGAISVHGQDGREIIVLRANLALQGELIRKQNEDDSVEVVFDVQAVKEAGGLLEVFDAEKSLSLVVAHHNRESGVFGKNAKGQLVRLSRVVKRPEPTAPEETSTPPQSSDERDASNPDVPPSDTQTSQDPAPADN